MYFLVLVQLCGYPNFWKGILPVYRYFWRISEYLDYWRGKALFSGYPDLWVEKLPVLVQFVSSLSSLPISIDPILPGIAQACSANLGNKGESSALLELTATNKD